MPAVQDNPTGWPSWPAKPVDFEAAYREYMPRVYNFFRYRFGDNALAEDLTAATFEKAWSKRSQYRSDLAAFTTWIFTIARRTAIDHYRQQYDPISLDEIQEVSQPGSLEDETQRRADLHHLRSLLERLDGREQELVALKYGAGLSNRAIAGLTGLTESNVGVILHRAVQTLRSAWETSHER